MEGIEVGTAVLDDLGRYRVRERVPERRRVWRQKVVIHDIHVGPQTFYIDFGEYEDERLAEVFITSQKTGTFVRGTLDTLARSISLALQCGTSPHEIAHSLRGQCYPPAGRVEAPSSSVTECTSVADYIGQEIVACYGDDGRNRDIAEQAPPEPPEKVAGGPPTGSEF